MERSDRLESLIEGIAGKTLAAKMRRLMPQIDRRVREGVRHEEIVQTLNANGLTLNLNTFRSYLYRYRKKMRGADAETGQDHSAFSTADILADQSADDPQPISELAKPSFAEVIDTRKREKLGDDYLARSRSFFGKRSESK